MSGFASEHKSTPSYLDIAANGNGAEKSWLAIRALEKLDTKNPRILEIGPGGGAMVEALERYLRDQEGRFEEVQLSLLEMEGVESESLARARHQFEEIGQTALLRASATDLSKHISPGEVDIISASATLHEVYSYCGGYAGLHETLRAISSSLKEGGYFAYRDVYSVDSLNLHEKTIQSYSPQSWLRFIRMFVPTYLSQGTHPYHRNEDELSFRQNSKLTEVKNLDSTTDTVVTGPLGLFREVQRHYLTFRDHVWRSGVLGFSPILDGAGSNDWLDIRKGHKRVHFKFTASEHLTKSQRTLLGALSDPLDDDMYAIDGDIFDEVTDTALNNFLVEADKEETECRKIWDDWLEREGHETYAYLTLDQLIGTVALKSFEAGEESILLPEVQADIALAPRHYYNRFLRSRLSNPLLDAKQLVLFRKIPIREAVSIQEALEGVQDYCSRGTLASLYSVVNDKV